MKFIDLAKITIKSGDGGKGHISFRKEKFVPKGGPDGGNGGKGGDVIFQVDKQLNTLLDFRYTRIFEAEKGENGGKKRCTGRNGKDLIIRVPNGTLIKNAESGEILADLNNENQTVKLLKGGAGGWGNIEFVTATRQAPRIAQPGLPGSELEIVLELKLIADVGFVGLPNVGKSTLISVISDAKPKIADYQFTTLIPNLGIVKVGEYQNYTVADIPGLIEGASQGKGLGIQFLRHVERTKLLLYMLDACSDDPIRDYNILRKELMLFNPEMEFKQKLISISRIDCVDDERIEELKKLDFGSKFETILFSAVTHQNIDKIKFEMWQKILEIQKIQEEAQVQE